MYCPHCGSEVQKRGKYCSSCGKTIEVKKAPKWLVALFVCLLIVGGGIFTVLASKIGQLSKEEPVTEDIKGKETTPLPKPVVKPVTEVKTKEEKEKIKEVSDIIASAQEKVFTVITNYGQGSGFLINSNGDILTNAHVIEGETQAKVKDNNGNEFIGQVIGYSNDVDVALIRVKELKGKPPLTLNTERELKIGAEVIALGSPLGFENTATFGYISGVNRSFTIDTRTYEGVYQISAPIAPGSSGGPLLEKKSGHVVAINSARAGDEAQLGFSIPLYSVHSMIENWVHQPMTQDAILSLFYDANGYLYYGDDWNEDGYFSGGDYSDQYIEYYDFPYDDSYSEYSSEEYFEEYESEPDWNFDEEWYDEEEGYYEELEDPYENEGYEDNESLIEDNESVQNSDEENESNESINEHEEANDPVEDEGQSVDQDDHQEGNPSVDDTIEVESAH
ncbi:trypsin-like peptidase domain-containing protein [Bacillus sp. FJAT-47783]|uniref:trypsin-like peptidase domain-containing protein n=1 Tax=Bacillus sp. FJAT-47783 TaxID=2922712 RepID=UPI001FAB70C5|nr:trypsin-like peptidase domain-containing protein [Bacillus sp. FJAT-47783]